MTVGRWPLTARSGLSPFAGGCHSEGRLNLKAAGWPTEVPRPKWSVTAIADSVRSRSRSSLSPTKRVGSTFEFRDGPSVSNHC